VAEGGLARGIAEDAVEGELLGAVLGIVEDGDGGGVIADGDV
jgi:hypothetical protein